MRAGSGAGARGPVQGVASGKLLGWQPLRGKDLREVIRSHDEDVMCLRGENVIPQEPREG